MVRVVMYFNSKCILETKPIFIFIAVTSGILAFLRLCRGKVTAKSMRIWRSFNYAKSISWYCMRLRCTIIWHYCTINVDVQGVSFNIYFALLNGSMFIFRRFREDCQKVEVDKQCRFCIINIARRKIPSKSLQLGHKCSAFNFLDTRELWVSNVIKDIILRGC